MTDKKAVLLEHLEIVKNYISSKDSKNIKSAEFIDDTLRFYTTEDKSGEAVAEITLPEEMFLDGTKTELVSDFSWSITKYPKSTNPDLDGKAVLVLAVKSKRTVRYSFVSLDSVIARLTGGETESVNCSISDDVVALNVKVSEQSDNRIVLKGDGLYVGTVDNTPTWVVSTDEEVGELFSISGAPIISANSLGARNVGDIVKINENGVPTDFIVIHKGNPAPEMYDDTCDGVWVLRKNVLETGMAWGAENNNSYEKSKVAQYLNGTYLNLLQEDLSSKICDVKIPCMGISQSKSNKAFLLSGTEVGSTTSAGSDISIEGTTLDYFNSGGEITRIAKRDNGVASCWWLRTIHNTTMVYRVDSNGGVSTYRADSKTVGSNSTFFDGNRVRPAFILPYNIAVNSDGVIVP